MSGEQIRITLARNLLNYVDEQIELGNGHSRSDFISQALVAKKIKDEISQNIIDEAVSKIAAVIKNNSIPERQKAQIVDILQEELERLKKV